MNHFHRAQVIIHQITAHDDPGFHRRNQERAVELRADYSQQSLPRGWNPGEVSRRGCGRDIAADQGERNQRYDMGLHELAGSKFSRYHTVRDCITNQPATAYATATL